MTAFPVLLAQAPGQDWPSVIPEGATYTLLGWLAIYVAMLFTWAITATGATMDARKTFGRSVAVRWAAAAIGLLLFVVIPALAPRLLLPGAVLLAAVPIGYSALKFQRRVGSGLMRALFHGTTHSVFLAYRLSLRLGTAVVELSWQALQALLHLDWAALKKLPELAREARQRLQQAGEPAPVVREVVLLQENGLPLDTENDPRLKSLPKTVLPRLAGLVQEAVGLRAAEILLATGAPSGASIRYKIDGLAVDGPAISGEEGALVARAAKTIAGMSVSSVAHAQEGVFPIMCGDRRSDLFVTTAPSTDRESLVMRITADERMLVENGLGSLGVDDAALATMRGLIGNRQGLVLFAGRPDSGKSTTMYAAISDAERLGRTIATVEKSPRHRLEHVPQVRAVGNGGAGFVAGIETALRHDPDILVVRDIVDRETADACLRTAVSGRLVLAGFCADDAALALQRLLALGVDRSLARLALTGIVAQRLVRVLCESCKAAYEPTPELLGKLGLRAKGPVQFHRETGCPKCRGTGFQGRTGIFEVLAINDGVKSLLADDAALKAGRDTLRKSAVRTLQQSALAKVRDGVTSVQEVTRVFK